MAANPEAGAAPANPEAGAEAPTNVDSAVAYVSSLMEPSADGGQPQERETEEAGESEAGDDVQANLEEEPGTDEPTETDGKEPDPAAGEELPDTLDEWADALGMSADDLAQKLKVTVTVGGKTQVVTLAEAQKGYQLEADYRHKTADLAEQRKGLESERQTLLSERQQRFQQLDTLIGALEGQVDQGPSDDDLLRLLESGDVTEYTRQKHIRDQQQRSLQVAKDARHQEMMKAQHEHTANMAKFRSEQQKILKELDPKVFGDGAKTSEFQQQAMDYLKSIRPGVGMSEEEVSSYFAGPFSANYIFVLQDALRYRSMVKGQKDLAKKLAGKPKVTKPGASQRDGKADSDAALRDRLRGAKSKKGQMNAAMALVAAKL